MLDFETRSVRVCANVHVCRMRPRLMATCKPGWTTRASISMCVHWAAGGRGGGKQISGA